MWLNGFNYKFYKDSLKLALQHKQKDAEAKEDPAIVVNLKLFDREHKKQTDVFPKDFPPLLCPRRKLIRNLHLCFVTISEDCTTLR